jgi:starvation-inducible DNA-binding protein
MPKTSIDLSSAVRKKSIALLQAGLVDAINLGLQAKQAHWNLAGPNFIALHKLFDELAGDAGEYADTLAERIKALGGLAHGGAGVVAEDSRLPAYPTDAEAEGEHLKAIAASLASFAKTVRGAGDKCAAHGDAGSADLFTGLSRSADKWLWFVEAHG